MERFVQWYFSFATHSETNGGGKREESFSPCDAAQRSFAKKDTQQTFLIV